MSNVLSSVCLTSGEESCYFRPCQRRQSLPCFGLVGGCSEVSVAASAEGPTGLLAEVSAGLVADVSEVKKDRPEEAAAPFVDVMSEILLRS